MEISRNWRLQKQRYGLWGEICPAGHKIFPPRDICPDCTKEATTPFQFSGRGEVYSYTVVYDAPEGFEAPYAIALVRLEEGPMITARMTDIDNGKVYIGQKVEMVTRKISEDGPLGLISYGYMFRPPIDK